MCRRCGEPDRRGAAATRRSRSRRLLAEYGNGVICPCTWCGELVGLAPGVIRVPGGSLQVLKLERDRLMPGGSYAYWNLVPACGPCNRARTYAEQIVEDGCHFGSGVRLHEVSA